MAAEALAVAPPQVVATRPTRHSLLLVVMGLLVGAATFRVLRLDVGGLLVPLHVLPILVALPVTIPQLKRIDPAIRLTMAIFLALYSLSMIVYGPPFGDWAKLATSLLTILAVALMVRSPEDVLRTTIALALSLLVMNLNGFRGGFTDYVGYEPMKEVANKNAYSLYALPIVLLCGYALLHFETRTWVKVVFAAVAVSTTFLLFSGANRSGWGGLLMVAVLLTVQARRWRALIAVGAVSVASYAIWSTFGSRQAFEHRVEQTREGYSSDELRGNMIETAFDIAIDNPLLGISPQELPYEMARRLGTDLDVLDTHNFAAYIVGGSGFPTLFALFAFAVAGWRRPRGVLTPAVLKAHDLVRLVIVLFIIRGMFSREVLYVGPFAIAYGLALGLTMSTQTAAAESAPRVTTVRKNASNRAAILSRS